MPRRIAPCATLALVGILAFATLLRAGFANWDDPESVIDNPPIASLTPANLPTSLAAIYAMAERERFTEEDSKRRFTTLSVRQRSTRNAPRRFSTSGRFTGSSGTTRPVHDGRWREA